MSVGIPRPSAVESTGSDWLVEYADLGISVAVDHVVERYDGLWCELHVESIDPVNPGPLRHVRLNLLNGDHREREQRRLRERLPGPDWPIILDTIEQQVLNGFRRRAEPVAWTGEVSRIPDPFLVAPLVPRRHTLLLHAARGTGKTQLLRWLSYQLAAGRRIPGCRSAGKPLTVIFYDQELDEETAQAGLAAIRRPRSWPAVDGLYYVRPPRPLFDDLSAIRFDVQRLGADVVVIDSLTWAAGGNLLDKRAAAEIGTALDLIPCGKIIAAHQNKAEGKDREHAASASGVIEWENHARVIAELVVGADPIQRHRPDGLTETEYRLAIHFQKTTFTYIPRPLGFLATIVTDAAWLTTEVSYAHYDATRDPEMMLKTPLSQQVLAVLKRDGRATVAALADELERQDGTIRRTLARLLAKGIVVKLPRDGGVDYWGRAE